MHSQVFLRGCWAVMSCVMAVMAWLVSGEGHSERHTHCLGPTWGNSLKRWDVLETEAKLVWIIYIYDIYIYISYIWYIYIYMYIYIYFQYILWPSLTKKCWVFGIVWTCLDLIWNPDVQQPEQARLGVFESLTKDIPGDTAGSKQQTSKSLADWAATPFRKPVVCTMKMSVCCNSLK